MSVTKAKICFISFERRPIYQHFLPILRLGNSRGMNGNPMVVIQLVVQSSYATCILVGLLRILSMNMYYRNLKVKFRLYTPRRRRTRSVNQCSKWLFNYIYRYIINSFEFDSRAHSAANDEIRTCACKCTSTSDISSVTYTQWHSLTQVLKLRAHVLRSDLHFIWTVITSENTEKSNRLLYAWCHANT